MGAFCRFFVDTRYYPFGTALFYLFINFYKIPKWIDLYIKLYPGGKKRSQWIAIPIF